MKLIKQHTETKLFVKNWHGILLTTGFYQIVCSNIGQINLYCIQNLAESAVLETNYKCELFLFWQWNIMKYV